MLYTICDLAFITAPMSRQIKLLSALFVLLTLAISPTVIFAVGLDDVDTLSETDSDLSDNSGITTSGEEAPVDRASLVSRFKIQRELKQDIRSQKISELRQESIANRCTRIRENIAGRLEYYKANHAEYGARFQGIIQNLETAISTLGSSGRDTTELTQLIAELKLKINDFDAAKDELVIQLTDLDTDICAELESTVELKELVTEVQGQIAELRTQAKGITDFLKQDIVPALRSTKSQSL